MEELLRKHFHRDLCHNYSDPFSATWEKQLVCVRASRREDEWDRGHTEGSHRD